MDKQEVKKWNPSAWEAYLVLHALSAAVANGALLNPEAFDAMNQAQDALQQHKEDKDDNRPPRPPRGRPVGRIALQY